MKLKNLFIPGLFLCAPLASLAQNGVTLHGSVQTNILFPEEDERIGTGSYSDDVLSNTYADLKMLSKYVDAGLRVEYMEQPMPGFENDFKGWGVPNIYVKGKFKGL
jgi:hypothetical protein